jgi:hypothetical protein
MTAARAAPFIHHLLATQHPNAGAQHNQPCEPPSLVCGCHSSRLPSFLCFESIDVRTKCARSGVEVHRHPSRREEIALYACRHERRCEAAHSDGCRLHAANPQSDTMVWPNTCHCRPDGIRRPLAFRNRRECVPPTLRSAFIWGELFATWAHEWTRSSGRNSRCLLRRARGGDCSTVTARQLHWGANSGYSESMRGAMVSRVRCLVQRRLWKRHSTENRNRRGDRERVGCRRESAACCEAAFPPHLQCEGVMRLKMGRIVVRRELHCPMRRLWEHNGVCEPDSGREQLLMNHSL